MGLELTVGVLLDIYARDSTLGADELEDEVRHFRESFGTVNRWLRIAGIRGHREPTRPTEGLPWRRRIAEAEAMSRLQALAESVGSGRGLPEGLAEAHHAPTGVFGRVMRLVGAGPRRELAVEARKCPHLLALTDDSYVVPLPFSEPLTRVDRDLDGAVISAPILLEECGYLSELIGLSEAVTTPEIELACEALAQAALTDDWRRYAMESWVLRTITEGCTLTMRTGCALVLE